MDEYNKAVEYFNNKNYSSAESILLKIIDEDKCNFDSLNFLGIIQLNLGNFEKALDYFNKVVILIADHAFAYYNIGYCYEKINQKDLAISNYKKAIYYNGNIIDAYLNLGKLFADEENFLDAENLLLIGCKVNNLNSDIYNNLANLYFKLNKWDDALKYYESAIELDSNNPTYLFNLGSCYFKKRNYDLAIKNFNKSLLIDPTNNGVKNNLALTYFEQGESEKAIVEYNKILSNSDANPDVLYNLANCLQKEKNYEKAIYYYEQVIDKNPNQLSAYIKIGLIYLEQENTQKAEYYFNKAVKDKEHRAIAFTNLGVKSLEELKINEALSFFEVALKSDPNLVEAHYNKGYALLLLGNYKDGWTEYEWRKKRDDFILPNLSKPELKNQDIKGKRVIVYTEQGLGDTFQFVRYLKMLKNKDCYLIFLCESKLFDLFNNIPVIDELIIYNDVVESNIIYDYKIGLLSLPYYLKIDKSTIEQELKYFEVDGALDEKWNSSFNKTKGLKVGLVWAGNPKNTRDNARSISLNRYLPVLAVHGIEFYSLQVGSAIKQLNDIPFPINRLDKYKNFNETLAIINNLDLIITVDTSIAHLAGAINKPVWVLLPYLPDWRWLLNCIDTIWYPSMKLYRQQTKGDWESAINEVVFDLQKLVKKNNEVKITNTTIETKKDGINNNKLKPKLFLGLSQGENFGWGVCSKYLRKELPKFTETILLENYTNIIESKELPGYLFNCITNNNMEGLYKQNGDKTFGYTFFENELTNLSLKNSNCFDKIFAGSTWCQNKLKDIGIKNTGLLLQGIDPTVFYPEQNSSEKNNNLFIIFSGGKFELRKGQDLVLKAFKILQEKYSDIILINSWYNFWSESMNTMAQSKFIDYTNRGNTWQEKMDNIYILNGIDPSKIFTLPIIPNEKQRDLYLKSDIGLFPNRCEGGTNLVMMEYMACGKPVIASFNSGHKDVLNENNSIVLESMNEYKLYDGNNNLYADWQEPELDEIIEKIEFAYNNRNEINEIGTRAGNELAEFTWTNTAENLIKQIYN